MDDTQLRNFITAADAGSFNKAADAAYISRQALRQQIHLLETDLGFKLFETNRRGITLTDAGRYFYQTASKICSQLEIARNTGIEIASKTQVLKVENPHRSRLILDKVFNEFTKCYPDIQLVFSFSTDNEQVERLLDGSIDIAEMVNDAVKEHPELCTTVVTTLRIMCLMSSSHYLAEKEYIKASDLDGLSLWLNTSRVQKLENELKVSCPHASIKTVDEDNLACIYNACYNNCIYIAGEAMAKAFDNLVAVPLETDLKYESVIQYRYPPSPSVLLFIRTVKEVFPR